MEYRTKRILGEFVGGALAALVVALAAHGCIAHADELTDWKQANTACRDHPWANLDKLIPATPCLRREQIGSSLAAHGWTRGQFDVWYSAQQADAMRQALWAANNVYIQRGGNLLAGENALAARLRELHVPDDVAVAWYRDMHDQLMYGNAAWYAMLSNVIGVICLYHKGQQPYTLDF